MRHSILGSAALLALGIYSPGFGDSGPSVAPQLVEDLAPGHNSYAGSNPRYLIEVGGRILFRRRQQPGPGYAAFAVARRAPGRGDSRGRVRRLVATRPTDLRRRRAFWFRRSADDRVELLCSDGTAAGTRMCFSSTGNRELPAAGVCGSDRRRCAVRGIRHRFRHRALAHGWHRSGDPPSGRPGPGRGVKLSTLLRAARRRGLLPGQFTGRIDSTALTAPPVVPDSYRPSTRFWRTTTTAMPSRWSETGCSSWRATANEWISLAQTERPQEPSS